MEDSEEVVSVYFGGGHGADAGAGGWVGNDDARSCGGDSSGADSSGADEDDNVGDPKHVYETCTKVRCKKCLQKQRATENMSRPARVACVHHPLNTTMGTLVKSECYCCELDADKVRRSQFRDNKKGMTSTMTLDYVLACEGKPCVTCGYEVYVSTEGTRAPRQKTMGRIDSTKPHDNDPAQTMPQCWQCNMHQGAESLESSIRRWIATHEFNLQGRSFPAALNLEGFDSYHVKPCEPTVYRNRYAYLVTTKLNCKKARARTEAAAANAENELITKRWLYEKHILEQKGHCYWCGLALGCDISFDRLEHKGQYSKQNVVLAHKLCNSGRGETSQEEFFETARRVYDRYFDDPEKLCLYNNHM
jgi:hypothetical protein